MEYAADRTDLFDPYIRVTGGPQGTDQAENRSSTIRALLMDRAAQQARQVLKAVSRTELDSLPPVLRGLDRETRSVMTYRVAAMIAAFERFLSLDIHADVRERLDPVFRPIGAWVRGRYAVTSPALLVIQAILYSHCEWFRDCLWEAHSATRAYSELLQSGYPEAHCRFIAAIIAHQTLARTSWTLDADRDPPETFAYYCDGKSAILAEQRFNGDPMRIQEATARVIGESLFSFLGPASSNSVDEQSRSKRRLAAALVLHAMCLHARHHGGESTTNTGIKAQSLRFFDYLIETWDDGAGARPALVFIQYGRYVHRAEPELFNEIRNHIRDQMLCKKVKKGANLTFCLHRVGSINVWHHHKFGEHRISKPSPGKFPSGIGELIEKTNGFISSYEIGEAENLRCVLGLHDGDIATELKEMKVWDALDHIFNKVKLQHLACWDLPAATDRYFPAPLVGHVLHSYRDVRPKDFTALHVIGREPRSLTSHATGDVQLTIWLPTSTRTCHRPIWYPSGDEYSEVLTARYVAALMVGVLVSFAPRRLLLDYVSDQAREYWSGLIAEAFENNGGLLMVHYAEQVRALRADHDVSGAANPWDITAGKRDRQRWNTAPPAAALKVVGIDVGGTSIKAALFEVDHDRKFFAVPAPTPKTIRWSSIEGEKPDERIKSLLEKVFSALEVGLTEVDTLGVSLACPVADGVPVGVSGVLNNRKIGYEGEIDKGNPHDLHTIDFSSVARELKLGTATPAGKATVVLLNDGDADIRSGESEMDLGLEGKTLVFKEGTGIAFALFEAGSAVDHPCETAKAIINLRSQPDQPEKRKHFQGGQLGLYASKRKFGKLLPAAATCLEKAGLKDWSNDILGGALGNILKQALEDGQSAEQRSSMQCEQDKPIPDDPSAKKRLADLIEKGLRELKEKESLPVFDFAETSAQVAGAIFNVGKSIVDKFGDDCEKCHTEASKVFRQRAWKKIGAHAGDYVKGEFKSPAELPTWSISRPWNASPPDASPLSLDSYEKAAIGCAWVLGRWLADGIALSWDLYGMRELRLAGGPLSGATGVYIAQSARAALSKVYGFDLDPSSGPGPLNRLDWYASARRREVKALCLVNPPESSSEGGPLGAAMAAFDGYLAELKLRQLKACRNALERLSNPFFIPELVEEAKQTDKRERWILAEDEVAEMLEGESMVLGLTRERDGKFRRWDGTMLG